MFNYLFCNVVQQNSGSMKKTGNGILVNFKSIYLFIYLSIYLSIHNTFKSLGKFLVFVLKLIIVLIYIYALNQSKVTVKTLLQISNKC